MSLGRGAKKTQKCVWSSEFTGTSSLKKKNVKGKNNNKTSHSKREMKNALHDIIDRLDIDEKIFSELEHILIETNGF